MRPFVLLVACAISLSAPAEKAEEQDQHPVIVSKAEPEWGDLTSGYVINPAEIVMTINPSGKPDALRGINASLPDPVVRALAQWRFASYKTSKEANEEFISLRVPVRRKLDPDLERAQHPSWYPSVDIRRAVARGNALTAETAAELVAHLPQGEIPDHNRTSLLVYYAHKGAADVETARRMRHDLLLWLIHVYPQDEILSSSYALVNTSGEPLADARAVEEVTAAWFAALKEYPKDIVVAEGAERFLTTVDPAAALRIVAERKDWDLRSNVLGDLYARAGLGIAVVQPGVGTALATSSDKLLDSGLAASFRSALLESNDLKVVLSGVDSATAVAPQLKAHNALPAGYDKFCQALMQHTATLYPRTTLNCDPSVVPNVSLTHAIGASATAPRVIKFVKPIYPKEAQKQHLSGSVKFLAMIDMQGRVQRLELYSGPLGLYQAAYDAALQWQYQPALFAGKPSNVAIEVNVNFDRP